MSLAQQLHTNSSLLISLMDQKLATVEQVNTLSKTTGVARIHLCGGASLIALLTVYFACGAGFLCSIVGFVYPAIQSIKAIESADKDDDTLWLTYWVVFGFFHLLESFIDVLLSWMPFYYIIKFCFLIWCYLPQSRGAVFLYEHLLCPFLKSHSTLDFYVPSARTTSAKVDAKAAAAKKDE